MRRARTSHSSQQRGAAAVEFAIILPVLLLLVLGTIDWGYYFFVREVVVNASREGARAGTLVPPGSDPRSNASAAATQYLNTAGLDDAAKREVTADTGVESVIVTVRYDVGSITGFLGDILPAQAVGIAEMRR